MNALDLISANLAKPMTHRVLTTYDNGEVKHHDTRGLPQAQNWAVGERRNVGRKLIKRETGETVTALSVEIVEL